MKKQKIAKAITLAHITWCGAFITPFAFGAPGTVDSDSGNVTIADDQLIDGVTTTNISISGDFAEIRWEDFNILSDEAVDFAFDITNPESGIVVNNVLNAGSTISGQLTSTGHVVLINPRGVLFTEGASVDVGALTVSALKGDITARDGEFAFDFDDTAQTAEGDHYFAPGTIQNQGVITADSGVTLIGRSIQNLTLDGATTNARIQSATIDMVAADAVTLSLGTSGLYGVQVTSASLADELIVNGAGSVVAGATVLMTADAADAITATAVNNQGSIEARGIDTSGGVIRLTSSAGRVENSGNIAVAVGETGSQLALEVTAETGFDNSGTIAVEDFSLQVGANGSDSTSDVGNLSFTGEFEVTGGAGTDSVALDRLNGQLELTATDSENVSFNDGTLTGTLTGVEAVVADAADTLVGTENDDQFTLIGSGGARSNGIDFTGMGTLDGGGHGDDGDTLIVESDVVLSLADLASDEQDGIALSNIEAVQTNTAGISDVEDDTEFTLSIDADTGVETVSVTGLERYQLTNVTKIDASDAENVSLDAAALDDQSLYLRDTSGTVGTAEIPEDGIEFSGVSRVEVSSLDASDIGDAELYFRDVSGANLATASEGGTLFIGLTSVSAASLNSNGHAVDLTLGGALGEVTSSDVVAFSGVSKLVGSAAATVEGGGNWTLDGSDGVQETVSEVALTGAWEIMATGAELTGTTGSDVFTLNSDGNVVAGSDLTFIGVTSVAGGDGADSLEVSGPAGPTIFLQNDAGTSASTTADSADGILFSGLTSITAENLDANSNEVTLEFVSGELSTDTVSFIGVSEFVGSEGATVSGGDGWELTSGTSVTEVTSATQFSGDWLVQGETGVQLTDFSSGLTFNLASAEDFSIVGSDLAFQGFSSVAGSGSSVLNAADLGSAPLFLMRTDGTVSTIATSGQGVDFSGFGEVQVASLDASEIGENALFFRNASGSSLSTAANGGTQFTGLSRVAAQVLNTNDRSVDLTLGTAAGEVESSDVDFAEVDTLVGTSGALVSGGRNWTIDTGSAVSEDVSGIQLEGSWAITTANNATLEDSGSDSNFTLIGNDVGFSGTGLVFSNLGEVNGGAGSTLDASALSTALYLTDSAGTVSTTSNSSGVEFSSFSSIEVDHLDATSLADSTLYLRNVTGTSVSTTAAADTGVTVFSELEQVSVDVLHSNGFSVSFEVSDADAIEVEAGGTQFDQLSEVTGSTGAQISGGANWALESGGVRESTSSILFSDTWFVEAVTGAELAGTGSVDTFTLNGDGDVETGSFTFSGLSSVNGGNDTDILNATGLVSGVKVEGESSVSAIGTLFEEIETINTNAVTGADSGTLFTLSGGVVTVGDSSLSFNGITSVDGGTGSSSLDATSLGATPLYLLGDGGVSTMADGSGIGFTNLNEITATQLDAMALGSAPLYLRNSTGSQVSADSTGGTLFNVSGVQAANLDTNGNTVGFSVAGVAALNSSAASFTNLVSVSGGDGSTVSGGDSWALADTGGATESSSSVTFNGDWSVDATDTTLTGTSNNDIFTLNESGTVVAEGIAFQGLSAVVGDGGQDTLNAGSYAGGVSLTGASGAVGAANVSFTEITNVTAPSVTAADTGSSFVGQGNTIVADGLTFSSLDVIYGGNGSDSVRGIDALFLRADGDDRYFADSSDLQFRNIDTFVADSVSATDEVGAVVFDLLDLDQVSVASATISGLSEVDGNGAGVVDASGYSGGVWLTGANGQVASAATGGLTFSGVDSVTSALINGSTAGEAYQVTAPGTVSVLEMLLNGVGEVVANSGTSSVTAAAGSDWTLDVADATAASTDNIQFTGFSQLAAQAGDLIGTANSDEFTLNSDGDVEIGALAFSGLSSVIGGDGTDILNATGLASGVKVEDESSVSAIGTTFEEIETINTNAVTGADSGTVFTLSGGVVTVGGTSLSFNGITSVDGGTGSSSLDATSLATTPLYLLGDGGVSTIADGSGIGFTNLDVITVAQLDAMALGSEPLYLRNNTGSQVSADSTGGTLFNVSGVQAASLDANGNTVVFDLLGLNEVSVGTTTISGLSTVDGSGTGTVEASGYSNGVWLTGTNGQVASAATGGLTFSGVSSVTSALINGSTAGESYQVTAPGTVSVLEMLFNGVGEVVANSDNSSVIAAAGSDWALDVADATVASTDNIKFTGFTQLAAQAGNLVGTTNSEIFTLTGSDEIGQLVGIGAMQFSGLDAVTGGGGTDSLDAMDYSSSVSLNGSTGGELRADSLIFSGFSSADISALAGREGLVDEFIVTAQNTLEVAGLTISQVEDVASEEEDLVVSDGVASNVTAEGFQLQGINFGGADLITVAVVEGSADDDVFTITDSDRIIVNDRAFSLSTRVDGLAGNDTVIGLEGQDWTISGLNSARSQGADFINIERLVVGDAGLIGAAEGDIFTLNDDGSVRVGNIVAEGMRYIDGGSGALDAIDQLDASDFAGGLQLTGADGLLLAGELEVRGFESAISVALQGSGASDLFTVGDDGVVAGGITFSELSHVSGGGGSDRVESALDLDWLLGSADGAFTHAGIEFAGIATAAGGGALQAGESSSVFTLQDSGVLQVHEIGFEGVTSVDAGAGSDSVATDAGLVWTLDGTAGTASVSGVTFSAIEQVSTAGASVDTTAASAPQTFALSSAGAEVSVLDILFSSVASVVAGDGNGDTVVSSAEQWQLQGSENRVAAGGVLFSGIDNVEGAAAEVIGTTEADAFLLNGEDNSLAAAGIAFSGVEQVSGGGGQDTLEGTSGADSFRVEAGGDIRAAAMQFTGLASVDAGAGDDSVNGDVDSWTSATDAGGLVAGSAEATVDSLTVLFENLERVQGTGLYTGPAAVNDYYLSGPSSLTMGGVEFSGLQTLVAGSGANTLYGIDADMQWSLGGDQGSVSDGQSSLGFSGFDAIVAGSGADQFELGSTALTSLDTGAGNDTVQLQQAQLSQLSLGAGNDRLVVATAGQSLDVTAGGGEDQLLVEAAGQSWLIDNDIDGTNSVGTIDFSGFEMLEDASGGLELSTGLAFSFFGNAAQGSAGVEFAGAGMTLAYDPSGDLVLVSRSTDTIGGELHARDAHLTLAGNLDITSRLDELSIYTSGGDIEALVTDIDDLVIGQIDVGRGHLELDTLEGGGLTARDAGELHINAGSVVLGTGDNGWTNIGTQAAPLYVDISESLKIVAFSFVHPIFSGQRPTVDAEGNGVQSITSAQASQGLKSAVQRPADDIAQLDPGIFDEVTPYSLGINTMNAPEMRLTANGLQSAEDDEEEESEEQEATLAPAAGE
ncbi:filamentous hemagglutinin N-terminal domain-containing protein [uncultured Microbulbifer sp.]|uniref:filamentous hemagglutinin N-terminal domain-containing protein n=1 Tax=uncultured Microbulbifer sp. TaxID=348147 RepID=UPI00260A2160|nr:filamentous hemagglutinin N-terminal domain-containing protein [uncultured Microbulbifer sp.]